MAIEKKVEVDRMDITIDDGGYKHIQVRTARLSLKMVRRLRGHFIVR